MRFVIITIVILCVTCGFSAGAGLKISEHGNKHNFSSSNTTVNFRAIATGDDAAYPRSAQICVFCHTPHHSSGEGPLWNRRASSRSFFKHYSSSTLAIDDAAVSGASEYGQPNGSSRLCLSCHDGVTALGAVFTTPMSTSPVDIQFINVKGGQSGANVTLGFETFSTHHPVSFKYNATVRNLLKNPPYNKAYGDAIPANSQVKLDRQERMQCTTCHDPHQDKSDSPSELTPFWTTTTYDAACQTCHTIVPLPKPYPW